MKKFLFFLTLLILFSTFGVAAAELDKKSSTAIVIQDMPGTFWTSAGAAEEVIRGFLLQNGYKVVNEAQINKIRNSKAASLALDGNVNAILSLGKQYGVGQFVGGKATVHRPRINEFNMYTGTATLAVNAYSSSGKYVFSETATAKEVGYSEDEAANKALLSAAKTIGEKIVGGGGMGGAAMSSQKIIVVVAGVRSFNSANQIQVSCKGITGVTAAKVISYSGGEATVEVIGSVTPQAVAQHLSSRFNNLSLSGISGETVNMSF